MAVKKSHIWYLLTNSSLFVWSCAWLSKKELTKKFNCQVFGVSLSLWNKLNNRKFAEIFLEFVPQLIFLVFIFCYLIFLIFFKWIAYYADLSIKDTNTRYCWNGDDVARNDGLVIFKTFLSIKCLPPRPDQMLPLLNWKELSLVCWIVIYKLDDWNALGCSFKLFFKWAIPGLFFVYFRLF